APADAFHQGMEPADAMVLGEDVGDIALGVAAQRAAVAHRIDPLPLMATLRSDQHRHSEPFPKKTPTSASLQHNYSIQNAVGIQRPRKGWSEPRPGLSEVSPTAAMDDISAAYHGPTPRADGCRLGRRWLRHQSIRRRSGHFSPWHRP